MLIRGVIAILIWVVYAVIGFVVILPTLTDWVTGRK